MKNTMGILILILALAGVIYYMKYGISEYSEGISKSQPVANTPARTTLLMVAQNDGAPPFGFPVESISFSNGPVRLSGGFLKPTGDGPFPAVILVHGAGHGTFDEPAFRVHANAFVRTGFAVLVYDKRGSGKSTGELDTANYDDLAADLTAGVKFLRSRRDIIPGSIGFLGRSEGSWVSMVAASHDSDIAFLILSSGSAVGPYDQVMYWTRGDLRSRGASEKEVDEAVRTKADLWVYYRHVAKDWDWAKSPAGIAEREAIKTRLETFKRFSSLAIPTVADPTKKSAAMFKAMVEMMDFDPAPVMNSLKAPILEVIGANDEIVETKSTVAVFDKLKDSGKDVTVRVLPDVSHSLLVTTGQSPRYPDDYPEFAARWARARVNKPRHL